MTGHLLAIDVASELRTLCEAQLRGTWQVPAEIIRLAFRLGAEEASIGRRLRSFVIRWPGAVVDGDILQSLRVALDATSTSAQRQAAIIEVEGAGAEALLWAAGVRGARITVVCDQPGARLRLSARPGRRPRLIRENGISRNSATLVRWSCSGLDPRRAEAWLSNALRFADQRITLNGTVVPRGFPDGMFHTRIDRPVPTRLGLTRSGDEPVLWLLKNGVVAARAGLPGYPPFEAAIEMSGEAPGWASSADLRRAVSPHLPQIVDRAVWMMVEVAGRWPEHDQATRSRLALLLLKSARRGLRTEEIRRLRILPTAAGGTLSIAEVEESAKRRGGLVPNIESAADAARTAADPESALCVSGEVRSLLGELTGLRVFSPRGRRPRRIEGWRLATRSALRRTGRRLRGLFIGRPLAEDVLTPRERRTLSLLQTAVGPLEPAFCDRPTQPAISSNKLIFSRSDPIMVDAGLVLGGRPEWLYPVLLALDLADGSTELKKRWRRAVCDTD